MTGNDTACGGDSCGRRRPVRALTAIAVPTSSTRTLLVQTRSVVLVGFHRMPMLRQRLSSQGRLLPGTVLLFCIHLQCELHMATPGEKDLAKRLNSAASHR